jgi:hypothetical protein
MPPRRRTPADDGGDAAYDGVPTVNVELDAEPAAAEDVADTALAVVQVPALTDGNDDSDQGEGQQP